MQSGTHSFKETVVIMILLFPSVRPENRCSAAVSLREVISERGRSSLIAVWLEEQRLARQAAIAGL